MIPKIVCIAILFFSSPLQTDEFFNFAVWNVGQGAWSTYQEADTCFHFDMGGESFPWRTLYSWCGHKKNYLLLTHEDWDHINGLSSFAHRVPHLCLFYPKKRVRQEPRDLKKCSALPQWIQILSLGSPGKDRNAGSVIYLLKNQVLITGDAPMKEEKKWAHKIPHPLRLLILGHHGSQTSTSMYLLKKIRPQIAVASARKAKYGHPHAKVLKKLKQQKVPILTTEKWGNIFFQL